MEYARALARLASATERTRERQLLQAAMGGVGASTRGQGHSNDPLAKHHPVRRNSFTTD
eukprot:SAG25_NODE_1153_length_3771_cov_5.694989_2_plen_59_part_00